ncbi:DUF4438 domain-containing protein [Catenisphaera adipataccumulans]|jgi:hypothetical protein|uniref:DUF4438 domain-containing protein n=1 Tax=Catenisphaera adipataccumulans TaxID=700500 RepID=UPI003D8EBED0
MMNINKEQLIKMAVNGQVDHPRMGHFYVGCDGKGRLPVGTGGIVYNREIGDPCMNLAGDHVEPGVTIANPSDRENHALETLACIGNEAIVLNGPAEGAVGYVTGTHGGVDHTMLYFPHEEIEKMTGHEQFLVKAYGQGLKLLDYPEIYMMNIDPNLLLSMPIKEHELYLEFPVVTILPPYLMGAGLGQSTMMEGDYDIMTQDEESVYKYGIHELRFGDFVAVQDHETTYGPHYQKGSCTIGVVVHSDSFTSGHGPGLTVVATCESRILMPYIDKNANIKTYMEGMQRKL